MESNFCAANDCKCRLTIQLLDTKGVSDSDDCRSCKHPYGYHPIGPSSGRLQYSVVANKDEGTPLKSTDYRHVVDPTTERERFTHILEEIGSEFYPSIEVNGLQLSSVSAATVVKAAPVLSVKEICEKFDLPWRALTTSAEREASHNLTLTLNLLDKVNESKFQKSDDLQKDFYQNKIFSVVDTNGGKKESGYFYSMAHRSGKNSVEYRLDNKPDGTSKTRPILVEWKKSNFDCLIQCLKRMLVVSALHGFIKHAAAFSIEDKDEAFLILYESNPLLPVNHKWQKIHMIKFLRKDFAHIWLLLTEAPLSWYLTIDAPLIMLGLRNQNLHWYDCIIHRHAVSSSRVYLVTKSVGGKLESDGPSFIMKVNTDLHRFEKECSVLDALDAKGGARFVIAKCHGGAIGICELLKTLSLVAPGSHFFNSELYIDAATSLSAGGVLLMEVGEPVVAFNEKVILDIGNHLHILHEAGFVHCDMRRQNYLHFPKLGGFYVIDFDLACKSGDKVDIIVGSGQCLRCPLKVRELILAADAAIGESVSIGWYPEYDFMMFYEYIVSKMINKNNASFWNGKSIYPTYN